MSTTPQWVKNQRKLVSSKLAGMKSLQGVKYWEVIVSEAMDILSLALQQEYQRGYEKGVSDEIECVETSGEHVDLRKKLADQPKRNRYMKSNCCKASVLTSTADEGTSCWICSKCSKPCDIYSPPTQKPSEIIIKKILKKMELATDYCSTMEEYREAEAASFKESILEYLDESQEEER